MSKINVDQPMASRDAVYDVSPRHWLYLRTDPLFVRFQEQSSQFCHQLGNDSNAAGIFLNANLIIAEMLLPIR